MLKDYDINVLYYLSKENVVANMLSRLSMGSMAYVKKEKKKLAKKVHRLAYLDIRLLDIDDKGVVL